jgi:hypothetical protein
MWLASSPIPKRLIRLKSPLWHFAPPLLSDDATDASGAGPLNASVGRTGACSTDDRNAASSADLLPKSRAPRPSGLGCLPLEVVSCEMSANYTQNRKERQQKRGWFGDRGWIVVPNGIPHCQYSQIGDFGCCTPEDHFAGSLQLPSPPVQLRVAADDTWRRENTVAAASNIPETHGLRRPTGAQSICASDRGPNGHWRAALGPMWAK